MTENHFEELKKQLDRLERAIIGDEKVGHFGAIHRIDSIETKIAVIEIERRGEAERRKGALWVMSATATVAGAVGAMLAWLGMSPKH